MSCRPTVLMNDFTAEPEDLIQDQLAAVERVFRSGRYILGKEVEAFEEEWAGFCGASGCAGVGSGMDAIEIGLRAAGIGPGDEIITSPMTAFATVLAILRCGAEPVLADIDPETGHLSLEGAERCMTSRTRGVLYVHLYGKMGNMQQWLAFTDRRGVLLFEDCAQAHGARHKGRVAGTYGLFGAYSFYPTKNLGAVGDGGAVISSDAALISRCKVLRNYGQSKRYHHPYIGLNSRLDELQAAILRERLRRLDACTRIRRQIHQAYRAGLKHPTIHLLAPADTPEADVHHLSVLRSAHRDGLQLFLEEKGVETLIHYPIPVHHQEPCTNLRRDPAGLSCADTHAKECLSIPCHPHMSAEDVGYVIDAVNSFTGGK